MEFCLFHISFILFLFWYGFPSMYWLYIAIPFIMYEKFVYLASDGDTVLDPHCFHSEQQGNQQWGKIQYVNQSNNDVTVCIATLHQHCLTNSGFMLEMGNLVNNCRREAEEYIVCVFMCSPYVCKFSRNVSSIQYVTCGSWPCVFSLVQRFGDMLHLHMVL